MTIDLPSFRSQWFTDGAARRDVLAGMVVALALIPEAIGFSIIAGVDPRVGLYASVAIAVTIALIGGRPGMISAATAPSPLVAILVLSAVSIGLGLSVNTVGDIGNVPEGLPSLSLPDVPMTLETLRIILPYPLTMAAVGLLESLLTAQIVDDVSDTDSAKRVECAGQGGANMVAAMFGGMGAAR